MTEDIVEFGAPSAPRPKRVPAGGRPKWLANRMLPVAAAGAILGAASLVLPWQKLTLRPENAVQQQLPSQRIYEVTLVSLGTFGTAYLLALMATCTVVAVIFYAHHHVVPGQVRVIGTALSAANMVILLATALAFNRGTLILNVGFVTFGPDELEHTAISLDWGFFAAAAAVIALCFVVLRAQALPHEDAGETSASTSVDERAGGTSDEPDDGLIDLSVSIHPAGKQVAAG